MRLSHMCGRRPCQFIARSDLSRVGRQWSNLRPLLLRLCALCIGRSPCTGRCISYELKVFPYAGRFARPTEQNHACYLLRGTLHRVFLFPL